MILDVMTYNGEMKVAQLHFGVLYDYVDKFIVVEANKTFTGLDKPCYFFRDQQYFKQWWPKIEFYMVDDWNDVALWQQAIESPNTKGAEHWKREFYIKESIQKALALYAKDDDTLLIGDVDEIIDPMVEFTSETPVKARLRVYAYWLNNLSNEQFWGTLIAQYKDVKGKCLNHMRSDTSLYSQGPELGWHFTSMGGEDEVRRKLESSYTSDSYYTENVKNGLTERLKNGLDYLGRNFTFTKDETDWPRYLRNNRKQFERMCL